MSFEDEPCGEILEERYHGLPKRTAPDHSPERLLEENQYLSARLRELEGELAGCVRESAEDGRRLDWMLTQDGAWWLVLFFSDAKNGFRESTPPTRKDLDDAMLVMESMKRG